MSVEFRVSSASKQMAKEAKAEMRAEKAQVIAAAAASMVNFGLDIYVMPQTLDWKEKVQRLSSEETPDAQHIKKRVQFDGFDQLYPPESRGEEFAKDVKRCFGKIAKMARCREKLIINNYQLPYFVSPRPPLRDGSSTPVEFVRPRPARRYSI